MAQLVARYVRDVEVAGSSLVTPTQTTTLHESANVCCFYFPTQQTLKNIYLLFTTTYADVENNWINFRFFINFAVLILSEIIYLVTDE